MSRLTLSRFLPVRATRASAVPAANILGPAARRAIQPIRRNVLHWCSWAAALAVEIGLLAVLRDGEIYEWEQSLTRALQDVPGKNAVFVVTSTLTNTLSTPFLLIFATIAGIVVISGHRWVALLLLLSFPLHVLAQFPKALIDRPRPSDAFDGVDGVGGLQSFPSGHAEYVITFYGFLAYFLVLHTPGKWQRTAIVGAWVVFTLATGFGRVAEGRHWPLDVFASYVVGIGLLSGLIWLHAALRRAEEEATVKGPGV